MRGGGTAIRWLPPPTLDTFETFDIRWQVARFVFLSNLNAYQDKIVNESQLIGKIEEHLKFQYPECWPADLVCFSSWVVQVLDRGWSKILIFKVSLRQVLVGGRVGSTLLKWSWQRVDWWTRMGVKICLSTHSRNDEGFSVWGRLCSVEKKMDFRYLFLTLRYMFGL